MFNVFGEHARFANRDSREPMIGLFLTSLAGLIAGSLGAAVFGAILLRRNRRVESEISSQYDKKFREFESEHAWRKEALSELLGPLYMQLERTRRAFARWSDKNLYLEAQVVRQANQSIRDLLLAKGHLIPPHLMEDASRLIEHYDAWLEEFDANRVEKGAGKDVDFVFAGPKGFPFPAAAETRFKAEFSKVQQALYGCR